MRDVILIIVAITLVVLAMSATDIADWFSERRKRREKKTSNAQKKA